MKEDKTFENNIIHLRGMEFYAYHGVLEEEKSLGQRFILDVDIYPNQWINGMDDIKDTISYAEVYTVVRDCVEKEQFQLIESLAEAISAKILDRFDIGKIRVEVHKPNAPIPGIYRDVSVEIIRGPKV